MMSGELITVVAESNSGKTTFAMDIINRNSKLGRKCFYINLEFAIDTMRKSRWLWLS
jgi:KaiC/GvpD/RAD55 family RecA-like ATPase